MILEAARPNRPKPKPMKYWCFMGFSRSSGLLHCFKFSNCGTAGCNKLLMLVRIGNLFEQRILFI